MQRWARRVDWCAVGAVPVVTLTALLDPVDTLNGAIQHLGMRLGGRRAEPAQPPPGTESAAPPIPTAAPAPPSREWPAGDVALDCCAPPRRPRGSRPPGRCVASRGGRSRVRP